MRVGRIKMFDEGGFYSTAAQGLEFIEVCCNSEEDAKKFVDSVESVKKSIAKSGIDVSCVGRWNHNVVVDGKLDAQRKQSYLDLLDAAVDVGAKTFVCGINYDNSISLYRNYTNAIEFFGELIDRADGRLKVAVQNCNWNNFVVSPEQWNVVLGELPELYIKYDASHCYNRHEDYLGILSDWGRRVAHVHIKGTIHAGKNYVDDPPAGMDDINWPSLFGILYARGYDGDLSIEPHSGTWIGERGEFGVAFTRDYIKQFINK